MPESPICEYLVATVHGDGFLCEKKPQFHGSVVELEGYHVTEQGWWGRNQKIVILPAIVVRCVQEVNMQPFTSIDTYWLGHWLSRSTAPSGQRPVNPMPCPKE